MKVFRRREVGLQLLKTKEVCNREKMMILERLMKTGMSTEVSRKMVFQMRKKMTNRG